MVEIIEADKYNKSCQKCKYLILLNMIFWKANVVSEQSLFCLTCLFPFSILHAMFIRKTTKSKKGKDYIQHQLVESVRTPLGPRQRIVLNLGFIDLPQNKWKELANVIESEIHKEKRLFTSDIEIENLARHYAGVIIKEQIKNRSEIIKSDNKNIIKKIEKPTYERVDIDSVSTSDVKTIGAEHIIVEALKTYQFDSILRDLNFSNNEIDYAKMLITGRLVHPGSERETARWINENSAIPELLGSEAKVYDNALHRTACLMMDHHEKIEQYLSQKARGLFHLKETIILYDLTNTYFEGSKRGSTIAKPARSKDRRHDRPLVTLALAVDEDGFPKRSKVLEGNISEPGTLEGILNDLLQSMDGGAGQKTIVIDAGIASEKNLEIIRQKGFKYVAVSRRRSVSEGFWDNCPDKELKLSNDKTILTVKLFKSDHEAWLCCHSQDKEAKEKAILDKKVAGFEKELKKISDGLSCQGTRKGYDSIIERIGRLKERYGVGSLYEVNIEQIDGKAVSIKYHKNPYGEAKEKRVGEYVLRTNRLDLSEKEISQIHRSLTTVEDSFRSMKSHLGLRPIHHKRDDTSIAHIFVSVMAYHFLAGVLRQLRQDGIQYNWHSIRNILSTHVRVTTTFKIDDGSTVNIRNSTVPTISQVDIYKSLRVKQQPMDRIMIKIPLKKPITEKCSGENLG